MIYSKYDYYRLIDDFCPSISYTYDLKSNMLTFKVFGMVKFLLIDKSSLLLERNSHKQNSVLTNEKQNKDMKCSGSTSGGL